MNDWMDYGMEYEYGDDHFLNFMTCCCNVMLLCCAATATPTLVYGKLEMKWIIMTLMMMVDTTPYGP
jgi:hypothetical protein